MTTTQINCDIQRSMKGFYILSLHVYSDFCNPEFLGFRPQARAVMDDFGTLRLITHWR